MKLHTILDSATGARHLNYPHQDVDRAIRMSRALIAFLESAQIEESKDDLRLGRWHGSISVLEGSGGLYASSAQGSGGWSQDWEGFATAAEAELCARTELHAYLEGLRDSVLRGARHRLADFEGGDPRQQAATVEHLRDVQDKVHEIVAQLEALKENVDDQLYFEPGTTGLHTIFRFRHACVSSILSAASGLVGEIDMQVQACIDRTAQFEEDFYGEDEKEG